MCEGSRHSSWTLKQRIPAGLSIDVGRASQPWNNRRGKCEKSDATHMKFELDVRFESLRVDVRKDPADAELPGDEVDGVRLNLRRPDLRPGDTQRQQSQQAPVAAGEVEQPVSRVRRPEDQAEDLLRCVMLLQRYVEVLADRSIDLMEVPQRVLQHLIARVDAGIELPRPDGFAPISQMAPHCLSKRRILALLVSLRQQRILCSVHIRPVPIPRQRGGCREFSAWPPRVRPTVSGSAAPRRPIRHGQDAPNRPAFCDGGRCEPEFGSQTRWEASI